MEGNPDIVTAKAKVKLADAELNAVRMEVARKVIAQWEKCQAKDQEVREWSAKLEQTQTESEKDFARKMLIDAEASRDQVRTELRYQIGHTAPAVSRSRDSEAVAKPLQMPTGPMVEKVRKALASPAQMEFIQTPLSDAVDYLKDYHGIEIQIDKGAFQDAGDKGADMPMTMNLKGISLGASLQLWDDTFRRLKLVVRDYGILVTTPDRARAEGYMPVVEFARLSSNNVGAPPTVEEYKPGQSLKPVPTMPPKAQVPHLAPPRPTHPFSATDVAGSANVITYQENPQGYVPPATVRPPSTGRHTPVT